MHFPVYIFSHHFCFFNHVFFQLFRLDKKNFLEKHDQAFMIPKKFEYQPVRRDESELIHKPVIEVRVQDISRWKTAP